MPLPNLIVIGSYKSGTTSLHHYLDQHPQISMSAVKELNFFVDSLNWEKGLEWYEKQFVANDVVGESSVMYSRHPRGGGVAKRIHECVPHARLIYIVRDPIERIRSQYVDESTVEMREHRSFNTTIESAIREPQGGGYLDTSRYGFQLEQYLRYFSRDRIHVIFLEEFVAAPAATLRDAFRFLGVNPEHPIDCSRVMNEGKSKQAVDSRLLRWLPHRLKRQLRYPRSQWIPDRVFIGLRQLLFRAGTSLGAMSQSPDLERALVAALRADMERFQSICGRPLPAGWRPYTGNGSLPEVSDRSAQAPTVQAS